MFWPCLCVCTLITILMFVFSAEFQDEFFAKFRNVALNKNTIQSSTEADMISSAALDGTVNNCAETTLSESPWWLVDLVVEHDVQQVAIWSRTKCCGK